MVTKFFLVCCLLSVVVAAADKKNVVFVLVDDQDLLLGSLACLNKTRSLLIDQGAYFTNAFVATPICCPSRATIQTGRYMHNTKVYDNGCGGTEWQEGPEKLNVAHFANSNGYKTFYAGKYLNNYGTKPVGGVEHIPPGWTRWFGLVGNSKYYDYDVSNNGTLEHHGSNYATDYFTDYIKNKSISFIKETAGEPFFVMLGSPAPHVPNIFAPQYANKYLGIKAPRTPSWNKAPNPDKHWLLREVGPMDEAQIKNSDLTYADRWRALQSVDDMVAEIVHTLEELGILDDTYIIYSSDHGFHLGEFGMGFDKRQLYETDIRVPLLARGPGIKPGMKIDNMVVSVDWAPTILDMMGIAKPDIMDGRSWLPVAHGNAPSVWRDEIMVEYNGPQVDEYGILPADPNRATPSCPGALLPGVMCCGGEHGEAPCDAKNNTYACVRKLSPSENSIYCKFNDDQEFVEYYDINKDPWALQNAVNTSSPAHMEERFKRLKEFFDCSGNDCFIPPAQSVKIH
mmetsp:Transcript_9881/g.10962  ORF Transcript_9881/g.10962 Transcript_9881/m.10962 type:complete len:511 (+) Transcript_9881:21-1553(+)